MIPYYLGRLLQLAGLFIMAETLIIYFGQMMPLLQGSLLGVTVFYRGLHHGTEVRRLAYSAEALQEPVCEQGGGIVHTVGDYRGEQAPANQVDHTKQETEQSGYDRTLNSLQVVAIGKKRTPQNESDSGAAKIPAKSHQNERSLKFFLDPPGEQRRNDEKRKIERRANGLQQEILFGIVSREETIGRNGLPGRS